MTQGLKYITFNNVLQYQRRDEESEAMQMTYFHFELRNINIGVSSFLFLKKGSAEFQQVDHEHHKNLEPIFLFPVKTFKKKINKSLLINYGLGKRQKASLPLELLVSF